MEAKTDKNTPSCPSSDDARRESLWSARCPTAADPTVTDSRSGRRRPS